MLSGSALLRALLLVVAGAALVGFTRSFWTSPAAVQDKPAASTASAATAVRRPDPPSPRLAESAPRTASPAPAPQTTAAPAPPPVAETRSLFEARPTPSRSVVANATPASATPERKVASADPEIGIASEGSEPRAAGRIDLNTASLAELNGLQGAGSVGRTIIQHRPYGSVDQLLSKRVLSRALYQRVKDQVTVR